MILIPKTKLYTPEGYELARWAEEITEEEITWEVEFDGAPFFVFNGLSRTTFRSLDQVLKETILR